MPDRQREDHRQRQDEALVLADQHQVDEHDHDQEDIDGRVALARLVIGQALPAQAVAVGSVCSATSWIAWIASPLAVARGRRTLDGGGGIEVVAVDLVQALLLLAAS